MSIDCTNKMLFAAIKQAVKDEILPKQASIEQYTHNYESMKRVIEAALLAQEN